MSTNSKNKLPELAENQHSLRNELIYQSSFKKIAKQKRRVTFTSGPFEIYDDGHPPSNRPPFKARERKEQVMLSRVTKRGIEELEQCLGKENLYSIERLKRRIGIATTPRQPLLYVSSNNKAKSIRRHAAQALSNKKRKQAKQLQEQRKSPTRDSQSDNDNESVQDDMSVASSASSETSSQLENQHTTQQSKIVQTYHQIRQSNSDCEDSIGQFVARQRQSRRQHSSLSGLKPSSSIQPNAQQSSKPQPSSSHTNYYNYSSITDRQLPNPQSINSYSSSHQHSTTQDHLSLWLPAISAPVAGTTSTLPDFHYNPISTSRSFGSKAEADTASLIRRSPWTEHVTHSAGSTPSPWVYHPQQQCQWETDSQLSSQLDNCSLHSGGNSTLSSTSTEFNANPVHDPHSLHTPISLPNHASLQSTIILYASAVCNKLWPILQLIILTAVWLLALLYTSIVSSVKRLQQNRKHRKVGLIKRSSQRVKWKGVYKSEGRSYSMCVRQKYRQFVQKFKSLRRSIEGATDKQKGKQLQCTRGNEQTHKVLDENSVIYWI